jgi:hypothetical protein
LSREPFIEPGGIVEVDWKAFGGLGIDSKSRISDSHTSLTLRAPAIGLVGLMHKLLQSLNETICRIGTEREFLHYVDLLRQEVLVIAVCQDILEYVEVLFREFVVCSKLQAGSTKM